MHKGDGRYSAGCTRCFRRLGWCAMNDYLVEVQVNKGKQAVRLYPRQQAYSEVEAKVKGKRFANSLGYHGTMTYHLFDGGPVVEDSEFVF